MHGEVHLCTWLSWDSSFSQHQAICQHKHLFWKKVGRAHLGLSSQNFQVTTVVSPGLAPEN